MKYQLASEDEHVFRVRKSDGTEFSIAKNSVGPAIHKRIKSLPPVKMAEGGEVPDDGSSGDDSFNKFFGIGGQKSPLQDDAAFNSAFGINQDNDTGADPNFDPALIGGSSQMPDTSTPQAPIAAPADASRSPQSSPEAPVPGAPGVPANEPQPQLGLPEDLYANAFAQKESAINQSAQAQAQASQAQAKAYEDQVKQMAAQQADYDKQHAALEAEHKKLTDAVLNDKIDPNRMYHNMSTGNKILAAISVALAGIGQGLLRSNKNMAMEVLNNAQEQDIEAQKSELGKKENLLSDNLRRFGDLNTATQMTRLQMNAMTQARIMKAAAQSGSVQAQSNAKSALADLAMQAAQIKRDITLKNMALHGGNYDPSMLVPYVVPKEQQKEVFNEIKQAQNTKAAQQQLMDAFDTASKDNTVLRTGAGLVRTPASILKMRAMMLPIIHDAEGRVNEFEQRTTSDLEPKPGDTDAKIAAKRQALQAFLQQKMAAPTAKGFGIDLNKFGATNTESAAQPVQRITKDGRVAMFDPNTRAFLGYRR